MKITEALVKIKKSKKVQVHCQINQDMAAYFDVSKASVKRELEEILHYNGDVEIGLNDLTNGTVQIDISWDE